MSGQKISKFAVAIAVAFGLAACATAPAEIAAAPPTDVSARPMTIGTTYQIQSDVYGGMREINVYAPEPPEWAEQPLPVLYVVDGGVDQDFIHIAGLSQLSLVNGEKTPLIVVGVKTDNRRVELTPVPTDARYQKMAPSAGGAAEFLHFLANEVQPFIEARYQTGRRALIGESLAGLFIADVFFRAPQSFDDYIAISPSLWWDDQRLGKDAAGLLANHESKTERRLYLTMADEGGTMREGLDKVMAALKADAPSALNWTFVDRADEDRHSTIYHHAARDALNWLYGMPAIDYGPSPWYLRPGGQPEEDAASE